MKKLGIAILHITSINLLLIYLDFIYEFSTVLSFISFDIYIPIIYK